MRKPTSKKEASAKLLPAEARIERIKLADNRDMVYEKFRTNVRLLRAEKGWSGVEASDAIGLKDGRRILNLEYGKGSPSLDEIMLIAKAFSVSMDDLMYGVATIVFTGKPALQEKEGEV